MKNRKILVVDDDPGFRDLMQGIIFRIFNEDEVDIVVAEDGKQAIEVFDKHSSDSPVFDCIITDFVMPEATGSDVIEYVMQKNPVPIVVVSAFQEALEHDFIQEGAVSFLRKPFSMDAAKNALETAIALNIIPDDIQKARDALDRLKKLNI